MKKLLFLFALITIFSLSTFADIRLPDKIKPSPTATPKDDERVNFQITVTSNFDEPTLVIPRNAIKGLRAQLDEIEGTKPTYAGSFGISGTQTLMSGLFFSVALIFGGVWMFRGKSLVKNQKIVSGLLIFACFGASVVTIFANVAPPILENLSSSVFSDKMRNQRRTASGKVKISIVDSGYEGNPIRLYIPRNDGATNKSEE